MANQEREYVIVNPNDPVVADLWKDVIQVDSNSNPQLDEQGRIIVKRYVVRGSSGVLKSEMDSAINGLNLKAVHNTDDETISGVKTFTSSPIAPTPNETVNNTQVATTAFVKNITNNLSNRLETVSNKSNAIAVNNTPSQSLESGSGEIVPNTAKLNTVDLSEIRNNYLTDLRGAFINVVLDKVYPVGSIYISVNSTNPSTLFGGKWERIQEKFLLSAGNTHTAGTTGGEFTHTLTIGELPAHNHTASSGSTGAHTHTRGTMEIYGAWDRFWSEYNGTYGAVQVNRENVGWLGHDVANVNGNANFYASRYWTGATSENGAHTHTITVNNNGAGNAHNNTPPYLAVYMWKRVA